MSLRRLPDRPPDHTSRPSVPTHRAPRPTASDVLRKSPTAEGDAGLAVVPVALPRVSPPRRACPGPPRRQPRPRLLPSGRHSSVAVLDWRLGHATRRGTGGRPVGEDNPHQTRGPSRVSVLVRTGQRPGTTFVLQKSRVPVRRTECPQAPTGKPDFLNETWGPTDSGTKVRSPSRPSTTP